MRAGTTTLGLIFTTCSLLLGCKGSTRSSAVADAPQKVMPTAAAEKLCNDSYAKNQSGRRLSWKDRRPIVFSLDVDFPTEYAPAIAAAIATWNEAAGYELIALSASNRTPSIPANDGQNTIYFLAKDAREAGLRASVGDSFHEDGGIAATIVSGHANRITDADIVFDGVNKSFSMSRLNLASFDLETIALHEIGHALGLTHRPEDSSTMYYGLSALGFSSRGLDETSEKLLDCEYR